MALTFNKATRDLSIKATITLNTGQQIHLANDEIISYNFSASTGSEGLPLGTTEAASYTFVFDNTKRKLKPAQMDNAEVHVFVGIFDGSAYKYEDFGVWYVDEGTDPEQSVSMTLTGMDALASRFGATFTDTKNAYPCSLGDIAETVCLLAGIRLKNKTFYNSDLAISKMPSWKEGVTLRDIISYCAICAAGFARIDRNGQLEIISYADGAEYSIGANLYQTLTETSGSAFAFNAIQARLSDDAEDYSRFAIDESIEDGPTTTIQIEYNPLLTKEIVNTITSKLSGLVLTSADLSWGGDPQVKLGDIYAVTNLNSETVRIMVTSQSFTFDGGLSVSESCELPAKNSSKTAAYSTSTNMYNADGTLNATRIDGLDKSVIKATVGHFEQLTAGTVEADALTTALLNAINLKAGNIDSGSVKTDVLTSIVANVIEATIKKLQSGTITSDELYATYAELFGLVADRIKAGQIETDALAAAFAELTTIVAGTATFDAATVQHLVAQALNLEFGTAGQVFIKNLAVEYAQMVGAAIGELCIKASDGNYYLMDVNPDGTVTATKTNVSGGEIAAGQTSGGKLILDTNITAANLNAGNLLATYALLNQIDAARINVDQLFARDAFVTLLRTTKIVGDTTITVMVDKINAAQAEASETARVFRQETFPGSAEKVKPRDLLVIPSTGQVYQAVDMSYLNLRFYLEDNGDLTYTIEDSTDHYKLEVRGYDLYAENFVVSIRDDGTIGQPYVWELVRDMELQSEINAQAEAMAQAVAGLNKDIESLQDQLDGNITTWFEDYIPTATNLPASEWVTDADKNLHIGDLFYVDNEALEEDGYCYRWQLVDGVYGWVLVRDSAVTKALEEAKEAKDLADSKRRIFVATPVPPYDVGDMWVQGANGDILRCNAAKAKGQAYAASDWVIASKYTDDTKAKQAIDMVNGTVASVDVEYALSASPTVPPEASAWSTVAPEWVNGKFMWSRTTTTLMNGKVYSSNVTCIAGAVGPQGNPGTDGKDGVDGSNGVDGVDGVDGVGIVSVSEQYYLSPSKVQPTGGEWLDYVPVWVAGMYMWTRTKVVYTNGNTTYTNPYCDTTWELAQDLSVYEGTLPPATPPLAGKLWLDMSMSPPIFRRWKGEDYETSDMDGWEIVNDTAYIDEAVRNAVTREDFTHVIRIETDGLHVGAEGSNSELLIDNDSLDVNIGGKTFTSLGANYVEFGNYQIRRTVDGGLAFKMR